MKALTIYQPWASLIMIGAKPWEFRGWDYSARYPALLGQRIVIHASSRPIKAEEVRDALTALDAGESSLVEAIARPLLERLMRAYKCMGVLETGAGLGKATIGKPRRVGEMMKGTAHADSDRLNHHLFGWPMDNVARFPEPIEWRGAQGFWNWPEGIPANAPA